MANLSFSLSDQPLGAGFAHVVEFEATKSFNLHIERNSKGSFNLAQKSIQNGKYATIKGANYDLEEVIDTFVEVPLAPMYFRIQSETMPTMAVVIFAE